MIAYTLDKNTDTLTTYESDGMRSTIVVEHMENYDINAKLTFALLHHLTPVMRAEVDPTHKERIKFYYTWKYRTATTLQVCRKFVRTMCNIEKETADNLEQLLAVLTVVIKEKPYFNK